MKYKIGWIARQFGITPQSVRFYEKEGIFVSDAPQTGSTRRYYARNYKWLSGIRRYLMMDFKTSQIRQIYRCTQPEEIQAHLQAQAGEIRREIARLQGIEAALDRQVRAIRRIPSRLGQYTLASSPDLYLLVNQQGQEIFDSEDIMARVRDWALYMPFVDSASVVHPLAPQGRRSGFCVDVPVAARLGLCTLPPVVRCPPMPCAYTVVCLCDGNPGERLFAGLEEFLRANRLAVAQPAFGRCLVKTGEEQCKRDLRPQCIYYEYWVPVKPEVQT